VIASLHLACSMDRSTARLPRLRRANSRPNFPAGDVVSLDSLGSHKGKGRRPSHSRGRRQADLPDQMLSDLNPTEQAFAKLRALLRKVPVRTVDAVSAAVAQILYGFTPQECANYFKNGGYASTYRQNALAN
jgi:transposase